MRRSIVLAASIAVVLMGVSAPWPTPHTQAATQGRWVIRDLGVANRSQAVAINERGQILVTSGTPCYAFLGDHSFLWERGRLTDLGTPDGKGACGVAMNDAGQVIGISGDQARAFLWQEGKMVDLGSLGGDYIEVVAINNLGQVIGASRINKAPQPNHAFLWRNGRMRDLGTLGGPYSEAVAINERGQIIGSAEVKRFKWRAFLWQNGRMTALDVRLGVRAINSRGQIVGELDIGKAYTHGFLWQNGKIIHLGMPGRKRWHCDPVAINERGQVIGNLIGATGYSTHAFVWQNGKMTDLGTLPGEANSTPVAINERGQIVGSTWIEKEHGVEVSRRAFVWQNGKMTELPTLGGKGYFGTSAQAISERGQIVGYSETKSGEHHAVLWTYKP